MLELQDVVVTVDGRLILDHVDLRLESGESVAVVGPSGSGKTTLLHVILGLIRPAAGSVWVAGSDLVKMHGEALRRHRAGSMGVIFQFGELLTELTPLENVLLPAWFSGRRDEAVRERASALLTQLGVEPGRASTGTLSGGERQRVAVARALINDPSLLLADEPTGALDSVNTEKVSHELFTLPRTSPRALLVVTHDPAVANRADRVLHLEDGRLSSMAPS